MKKFLIIPLIAILIGFLGTVPVQAERGGGKTGGKVESISDSSITITNDKSGSKTLKITPSTKFVKADGTAGAIADIKVGEMVRVNPGITPDEAKKIMVVVKEAKGGSSAAVDPK